VSDLAAALDIVGARWALLIVEQLLDTSGVSLSSFLKMAPAFG